MAAFNAHCALLGAPDESLVGAVGAESARLRLLAMASVAAMRAFRLESAGTARWSIGGGTFLRAACSAADCPSSESRAFQTLTLVPLSEARSAALEPAELNSGCQSGGPGSWSLAREAAFSAVWSEPGFQRSTVFLFVSARLAAAPAEAIWRPGDGNEGRSWGLAYFSEVAAPSASLAFPHLNLIRQRRHLLADDSFPSSSRIE